MPSSVMPARLLWVISGRSHVASLGQDWPFKSLLPRSKNENHYRYGKKVRSIIGPIALKNEPNYVVALTDI